MSLIDSRCAAELHLYFDGHSGVQKSIYSLDGVFGRFDLAALLRLPHHLLIKFLVCLFVIKFYKLLWDVLGMC